VGIQKPADGPQSNMAPRLENTTVVRVGVVRGGRTSMGYFLSRVWIVSKPMLAPPTSQAGSVRARGGAQGDLHERPLPPSSGAGSVAGLGEARETTPVRRAQGGLRGGFELEVKHGRYRVDEVPARPARRVMSAPESWQGAREPGRRVGEEGTWPGV
jgi:hypothetical protein